MCKCYIVMEWQYAVQYCSSPTVPTYHCVKWPKQFPTLNVVTHNSSQTTQQYILLSSRRNIQYKCANSAINQSGSSTINRTSCPTLMTNYACTVSPTSLTTSIGHHSNLQTNFSLIALRSCLHLNLYHFADTIF